MNAYPPTFEAVVREGADSLGIPITDTQYTDLALLVEDLLEWNQRMNLTAMREPREIAIKHILDSMTCFLVTPFPEGAVVLDVGTGAGFPGLVLGILRRDLHMTLLDSTQKKLSFVQHVIERLRLSNAQAVFGRAEEIARTSPFRESYDVVVARAVAPMRILAELCLPFARPGGVFLAMKGPNVAGEMTHATSTISALGGAATPLTPFALPFDGGERAIVPIRKVSPTPSAYPRLYRDIRRQPL